jgi:protein disulfide-isomerase|tara:strand:- start:3548 stop:3895 length:348 start_codon:yes stop_codon:yes gene_type:complete
MPVVTDINWVADYYEGLRISEGENKLLLLYFGADWCGFCQKMDEEVLNTSEVSSVIHEKFIPVFLNVDLDDNSKLISNYRVTVTPTFIITSEQEEIIDIVIGFRDRKDFLEFLEG